MFDTFNGLPIHALVVHGVVVLIPLSALGIIAMAVRPAWRDRFGLPVLALSVISLVMVPVATRSGKELKGRVNASGVVAEQIERHETMGERVLWPTLAMVVLGIVLYVLHRAKRTGALINVVAALAVVASVGAVAQVAIAGERGSRAVWSCLVDPTICQE